MRKTLFASCLILLLASGLVWSASAAATGVQASAEQVLKQYGSAHGAVDAAKPPPSPCTLTCWPDPDDPNAPPVSCTSQTGNCSTGGVKGLYWITCDGQTYYCPFI